MKAFTLIEIIVAIVIIFVLAGILLPVFSQARSDSKTTACANNLRNIGHAFRIYVDDNDGNWPDTDVWLEWRKMPGGKLATCPLVPANKSDEFPNKNRIVGYAYNGQLAIAHVSHLTDGSLDFVPAHDRDILFPSTTVSVCDADVDSALTSASDPHSYITPYPYGVEKGWQRHNGQGNYLFCDGHVKTYRGEQVLSAVPPINDGTRPAFALRTVPTR